MTEPTTPAPQTEQPWSRLDKRMLLVHPVNEVVKFIPALIAAIILGTSSGNHGWSIIPLVLIIGFALTRWFTTTYRVGPTHVELRTGLIQRKKLSVPRSRIRSVDIEADLLHRALGLAVLAIGTGQHTDKHEQQFKLDALDARVVPELRTTLLAHTASNGAHQISPAPASDASAPAPDSLRKALPQNISGSPSEQPREIGHWQASWVRYAPLSLTGFAIIAPIVGVGFQYGLGEVLFRSDTVHNLEEGGAILLAVAGSVLVLTIVVLVSLAACTRYLTTYFGLRVLDDGRTLHVRNGLFTRRQLTLDRARLRGATVNEPLLLRWAGGAELEAIMVGRNPRQKILPQAPRAAVERTLATLIAPRTQHSLETTGQVGQWNTVTSASPSAPVAPLSAYVSAQGAAPLVAHGRAARRRRYTRALTPILMVAAVLLVLSLAGVDYSPWWWLLPGFPALIALPLAEDRYRGLGHTVLPATTTGPAWLITRAGSLDRDRDCLEAPGIIGWTVRQSFWQRRSGVATVVAASAAGKKRYRVIDIPFDEALALIEAVTPGRLGTR
ncbi:PH domain-containing protein [Nocardia australiensis]|uniref:PH domain-containing protein n=1 Tax=Nocardia australiensis TaxID=2887191 RepID=UPI001D141261|nr:PH domain-containing protein [Nocardia australiensis]